MSTNSSYFGSSSVRTAGASFAPPRAGSARFTRPAQLDDALVAQLSGGVDPQQLTDMSHTTAAALLDRVHHTQDPQVVQRVLTLVEREGVDLVAELWSDADAQSLPGVLWRLYMLRTWMRRNGASISRIWRVAEMVTTSASAIVGVDQAPDAADIERTADSILSGAFTGDFAVALERAGIFCGVIGSVLAKESQRHSVFADAQHNNMRDTQGQSLRSPQSPQGIAKTAHSLQQTARDFQIAAKLWRKGELE